jgi:hypothetical protein
VCGRGRAPGAVLLNTERSKQMLYILHVSIPVTDTKGWHGAHHWPTLLLEADTMKDAGGKVRDIQKDLPKGTSITCIEFQQGVEHG